MNGDGGNDRSSSGGNIARSPHGIFVADLDDIITAETEQGNDDKSREKSPYGIKFIKNKKSRREEYNMNQTINGIRLEMKRTDDEIYSFNYEQKKNRNIERICIALSFLLYHLMV